MLMKLYGLQQPLVSRHTSEVLTCLVTAHSSGGSASSGGHLSSGQLAQLLGLLIDGAAGRILSGVCGQRDSSMRAALGRAAQGTAGMVCGVWRVCAHRNRHLLLPWLRCAAQAQAPAARRRRQQQQQQGATR
jgi:hypothetical protein